MGHGLFYYFGIQQNLIEQLQSVGNMFVELNINVINLICDVDGIPVTESTKAQFRPTLGMVFAICYCFILW